MNSLTSLLLGCIISAFLLSIPAFGQSNIQVVSPNGGESFDGGDQVTVSWTGASPGDSVLIEYSTDGGKVWSEIGRVQGVAEYMWEVPYIATTEGKIRVSIIGTEETVLNVVRTFPIGKEIYAFRFSPDGSYLAVYGGEYLKVIRLADGEVILDHTMSGAIFSDAKFNPNGTLLAAAQNGASLGVKDSVLIFGVENGSTVAKIGQVADVYAVAFSPDGTLLATPNDRRVLLLWNVADWTFHDSIKVSDRTFFCEFSPDGSEIAVAHFADRKLVFHEVSTGDVTRTIVQPFDRTAFPAFNSDWTQLIVTSDSVRIWDLRTETITYTLPYVVNTTRYGYNGAVFSPDKDIFAVWSLPDGVVGLWRLGEKSAYIETPVTFRLTSWLDWSPTGDTLAVTEDLTNVVLYDITRSESASDITDGVFTIRSPLASLVPLHDLNGYVGEGTNGVMKLINLTSKPIRVQQIRTTGPDAAVIEVETQHPSFNVPADYTWSLLVQFQPERVGPHTATVEVQFEGGEIVRAAVSGNGLPGRIALEVDLVDFGPIPYQESKDSTVKAMLRNTATGPPVKIHSMKIEGPNAGAFRILEGGEAVEFPRLSTHDVVLQCSPGIIGTVEARLVIAHNTGNDFIVDLKAEGTGTMSAPLLPAAIAGLDIRSVPNPVRDRAEIIYQVETAGRVRVVLRDLLGREVMELEKGYQSAGEQSTVLHSAGLASGMYMVVVETDEKVVGSIIGIRQ